MSGKKNPSLTQRDERMVARIRAGETLTAVGAGLGLSRERVRQIVLRAGVRAPHLGRPHAQEVWEFRAWLAQDKAAWVGAQGKKCAVCAKQVLKLWGRNSASKLRATCSPPCHLRYVSSSKYRWKDPEYRRKHSLMIARWTWKMRKTRKVTTSMVRHAARLLGKTPPPLKKPGCSVWNTERWKRWRVAHGRAEPTPLD